MNNTKREIQATENILSSWDCLKHLTKSEKERIRYQLEQIAKTSISEYRQKCNNLEIEL
jgi:hypothetical protein